MPRGDRTGPWGAGPMTGRRMGYCAGYAVPGYANPGPGLGLGLGYRGGGRGWRHMYYATGLPGWARLGFVPPVPPAEPTESELAALKAQSRWLSSQLEAINKRIEALEGHSTTATEA
ncbi:MAG: DUF5320 domain-containing protein [Anaerolineae bacterium]